MLSRCNIIIVILFLFLFSTSYSQNLYKFQDFGIKTNKFGEIEKTVLTSHQKDTIAIGIITIDDYYEDIAVYYKTFGEIRLYKNNCNGTYSFMRSIEAGVDVKSISLDIDSEKEKMFAMPLCNMVIRYKDDRIINRSNTYLNNVNNRKSKAPLKNILDEPRAFFWDISYIKQWQSTISGENMWDAITTGDIDRDGKVETVFTFYPTGDTAPYPTLYAPTTMVVFECIGGSNYRVDWDTLLVNGGRNTFKQVVDIDGDGNREFFGTCWDRINNKISAGIWECYGEGKYKWRVTSFDSYYTIEVKESKKLVFALYTSWGRSSTTCRWLYSMKTDYSYQFTPVVWAGNNFTGNAYTFNVGDIDEDGKLELILGTSQGSTGWFKYLDSTGGGISGYELKTAVLNEPLTAGWTKIKDFDGDNFDEMIIAGPGLGTGTLGVLKHTGSPGENSFYAPWWDSAGIANGPNLGIDTGTSDNNFCVLYPADYGSIPKELQRTHIFRRNGIYSFVRISYWTCDSLAFLGARFYDMNNNGKQNIMAPITRDPSPEPNCYLTDYEQFGTIGINTISTIVPSEYKLEQNFPNPFNPTTKIKYHLKNNCNIILKIYDILGKELSTLINEKQSPGTYEVTFDGKNLSSGVYFYRIQAGDFMQVKRMVLIK